jgi:hypothetical protein
MADETLAVLRRVDVTLSALLAIAIDRHLRDTGLAQPRPRSIDRMLVDAGLTASEAARLLGKSPQAVSQILAKDGKSANARKGAKSPVGSNANGQPALESQEEKQ